MSSLITIYRYNSTEVKATIYPDEQSNHDCGIMRGDLLNMSFTSPVYINFQVGDYCNYEGLPYRINREIEWTKTGKRDYSYSFDMEGPYHQLARAQCLFLNANNIFTESKYSLTGQPVDFVDLAIANLKRVFPNENWSRGLILDGGFATLDFDGTNCLQLMVMLAERYQTEFLVDGYKLGLLQTQLNSGITLELGKGKALWSVAKSNQDDSSGIITRLYVYGSDKNIGDNYRNGAARLRMADGLYLEQNINRNGIYEATVVFDGSNDLPEIKPERIGSVSSIGANNVFTDAAMTFDLNNPDVLMPGVAAKVTFNTGLLAGITFEISNYNNATKTFTINPNTDSQTATYPNNDFKPAVGDKYVLTDIIMPLAYVTDAESRLKIEGQKYLAKKGQGAQQFTVACNTKYFRENGIILKLGYGFELKVDDANVNRSIRLMGFNRSLRNKFQYNSLTLADSVVPQSPIIKLLNGKK